MKKTLRHIGLTLAAVALGLPLGGCSPDEIVEVNIPDVIDPGKLQDANGAAALRAGAIGDFAFAIDGDGGGTEGQTLVSGLLSDEYRNSDTFGTRQEIDQRGIEPANVTLTGVFRNIHRARLGAERAATALQATSADPATDPRIAEMHNVAGFTYVIIGENYCSGVPFPAEGETSAPPLATSEIFNQAIVRFDRALANTGGSSTMEFAARVGKGRAQLNLGQFAAAATTVAPVTSFQFLIEHSLSTQRQQNGVYVFNALSERWSMSDLEGGSGLPFLTATDPRVPYVLSGTGFDAVTPLYILLKYTDYSDPTPLADDVEARLIEAEAALQPPASPPSTAWLDELNALRATVPGLSPLSDPGTEAGRVDLLFRERAFWLYATGHRLGDLRRLVRQYGRDKETVFPTGAFFKGGVYGPDVNLPVPKDEQNNPSFTGCLNRDA
jgi:hypothetical protein